MENKATVRVDLLVNEGLSEAEILVLEMIRNTNFGAVTVKIQNGVIVSVNTDVCIQVSKFYNKTLDKANK